MGARRHLPGRGGVAVARRMADCGDLRFSARRSVDSPAVCAQPGVGPWVRLQPRRAVRRLDGTALDARVGRGAARGHGAGRGGQASWSGVRRGRRRARRGGHRAAHAVAARRARRGGRVRALATHHRRQRVGDGDPPLPGALSGGAVGGTWASPPGNGGGGCGWGWPRRRARSSSRPFLCSPRTRRGRNGAGGWAGPRSGLSPWPPPTSRSTSGPAAGRSRSRSTRRRRGRASSMSSRAVRSARLGTPWRSSRGSFWIPHGGGNVDQSALLFAVGLAGVVALLDAPAGGAVLLLLVGLPAIIGAVRPRAAAPPPARPLRRAPARLVLRDGRCGTRLAQGQDPPRLGGARGGRARARAPWRTGREVRRRARTDGPEHHPTGGGGGPVGRREHAA